MFLTLIFQELSYANSNANKKKVELNFQMNTYYFYFHGLELNMPFEVGLVGYLLWSNFSFLQMSCFEGNFVHLFVGRFPEKGC